MPRVECVDGISMSLFVYIRDRSIRSIRRHVPTS